MNPWRPSFTELRLRVYGETSSPWGGRGGMLRWCLEIKPVNIKEWEITYKEIAKEALGQSEP